MKFFYVDDFKLNLKIVEMLINQRGHECIIETCPRKALEIIPSQEFDAILLDICMPDLDGFTLAELLRERNVAAPMIALSATDRSVNIDKALASGMIDFVEKPITLSKIEKLIKDVEKIKEMK